MSESLRPYDAWARIASKVDQAFPVIDDGMHNEYLRRRRDKQQSELCVQMELLEYITPGRWETAEAFGVILFPEHISERYESIPASKADEIAKWIQGVLTDDKSGSTPPSPV